MVNEADIPLTFGERLAKYREEHPSMENPASEKWFDRNENEQLKKLLWAAPYDARFPQVRKQRHCFTYYVDYHRCLELMGVDYKPCKFFQNVYKDFCPDFWVEKWDDLVNEGRFPAKFDR